MSNIELEKQSKAKALFSSAQKPLPVLVKYYIKKIEVSADS
jgi:hypothetical protein